MPITQTRMLSVITAARAWEAAWRGLRALTLDAIQRHARAEITIEQLYTELGANASATEPGAAIQITLATEEQHFNQNARRNGFVRERMAAMRQRRTMEATPKHLQPISADAAAHARATAPAFAPGVNPLAGLAVVDAPTAEQLAADAAMMDDEGIEEELRAHLAELRKGDQ